jgi:hypothetical protein
MRDHDGLAVVFLWIVRLDPGRTTRPPWNAIEQPSDLLPRAVGVTGSRFLDVFELLTGLLIFGRGINPKSSVLTA